MDPDKKMMISEEDRELTRLEYDHPKQDRCYQWGLGVGASGEGLG